MTTVYEMLFGGLMLVTLNQAFPFTFNGAADDPVVYARYRALTTTGAR